MKRLILVDRKKLHVQVGTPPGAASALCISVKPLNTWHVFHFGVFPRFWIWGRQVEPASFYHSYGLGPIAMWLRS